jgi:signal transduction histidine kinase
MRRLWKRLNHKIKHQVYLRVLPVVALSVLLVGTVGWVVFTRSVTGDRALAGNHALQDMLDNMALKIITETLSMETRFAYSGHGQTGAVQGIALIDHRGLDRPRLGTTNLTDPLASYLDDGILESWVSSNERFLSSSYRQGTWTGARPAGTPSLAVSNKWHPVYIFPPLLLNRKDGLPGTALIPVVVRGDGHEDSCHHLYLFELASLVNERNPDQWWCLLDGAGRILHTVDGEPAVGSSLDDQGKVPGHPVLESVSGQDLLTSSDAEDRDGWGQVGSGLVPWLVLHQQSEQLGLTALMVDRAEELRATVTQYLFVILLAVVLALTGAVYGINLVMRHTSDRLSALSSNMEALARGDYSGRMPQYRKDELGNLIGFFNLMAVSLDEAHRQVKDKAAHLRAALENMRMLDKAKDDFMVLISHEVRTPLTAIMGGVDYLLKSVERASPEDREVLQRLNVKEISDIIHSSGERLGGFMTDAIQMTSVGSSETRLNLRPVPVRDMVAQGLCGVSELANLNQVTIHNQLDGVTEWSLLCDPEVLRIGFEKVFKNAVTHNREGGVVVITESLLVPDRGPVSDLLGPESLRRLEEQQAFEEYEDDDLYWRLIEIYNTGKPIPADRRAALFGKFELVGRIENHQKGSGLSLPIAKAAIESHGGRIFLYSHEHDGNSFFIMLPTIRTASLPEAVASEESGNDQGNGIGGAARHEQVGQASDPAGLQVELDDFCTTVLGGVDQAGGGVNSPGGADHEEEVAITRLLK